MAIQGKDIGTAVSETWGGWDRGVALGWTGFSSWLMVLDWFGVFGTLETYGWRSHLDISLQGNLEFGIWYLGVWYLTSRLLFVYLCGAAARPDAWYVDGNRFFALAGQFFGLAGRSLSLAGQFLSLADGVCWEFGWYFWAGY
jgi:hypothetical protein